MSNLNIRRGRVGDVEEARRIFTYLILDNKPKMKKEIMEESLVSEDAIESCLNFLKHIGIIKIKRSNGKKLYYYNKELINEFHKKDLVNIAKKGELKKRG